MNKIHGYRQAHKKSAITAVAIICIWCLSGHITWNITRQVCYGFVHHFKTANGFRDTLAFSNSFLKSTSSIVWMNKNEVSYNGRIFDIKLMRSGSDSTVMMGCYDDMDSVLFRVLQNMFAGEEQQDEQDVVEPWSPLIGILSTHSFGMNRFFSIQKIHPHPWKNCFHYDIVVPPLQSPPDPVV